MWWLRLVGSLKLQVFFAEYRLFYGALLQKRPIILRSLLIVATQYQPMDKRSVVPLLHLCIYKTNLRAYVCVRVCVSVCVHVCACINTLQHTATQCNTLQHTATHWNTLQHTATQTFADSTTCTCLSRAGWNLKSTHCNTMQPIATRYNTLHRRPLRVRPRARV